MFLYRDHKGGLDESMATSQELNSKEDLVTYLQKSLDQYGNHALDCKEIEIESIGFDDRTKWDTHIVSLTFYGVLGYTDRPVIESTKAEGSGA